MVEAVRAYEPSSLRLVGFAVFGAEAAIAPQEAL